MELIRGKKIIGVGNRRVVYDLGNGYVLKKARSINGIKSNKQEVMMYRSSPIEIKKHLGHIQRWGNGYRWLVMKKYVLQFPNTNKYKRRYFELASKFRKYRIMPQGTINKYGIPHNPNLRLKPTGRIVVIDYGNFQYRH